MEFLAFYFPVLEEDQRPQIDLGCIFLGNDEMFVGEIQINKIFLPLC